MKLGKAAETIIKVLIFIAAVAFAVYKLRSASDANDVLRNIPHYWKENYPFLIFVVILMPFNWLIEAFKWKYALRKLHTLSVFKSFQSVMSGVSIGLFTPNRIGEFGGRIMYLPPQKRAEGSVLSMISSYSQFFTTLLFGIPAFLIFLSVVGNSQRLSYTSMVLAIMLALFLMVVYFNLKWVYCLLVKIPFLLKYKKKLSPLLEFPRKKLLHLLLLSMLRYVVFLLQFYFICRFFALQIDFHLVVLAVANLYFFMAMLPMFTIGEPGLRAGLTAMFFSSFTLQIAGVISASVLLWLINVLLVSLLGAAFLMNQKLMPETSNIHSKNK